MALDTEHWIPVFGRVKGVDSINVLGACELGTPTIVAPIFQSIYVKWNAALNVPSLVTTYMCSGL